jgi:hypothetical protein
MPTPLGNAAGILTDMACSLSEKNASALMKIYEEMNAVRVLTS